MVCRPKRKIDEQQPVGVPDERTLDKMLEPANAPAGDYACSQRSRSGR